MEDSKLIKISEELKEELREELKKKIEKRKELFISYFQDTLEGDIFESITGQKVSNLKTMKEIDDIVIKNYKYNRYNQNIVTERGNVFPNKSINIDKVFTDRLEALSN